MPMHSPPHAGEVLKEMYLEPLDLKITQVAKALGITRQALSEVVNGRTRISVDMAIRLAKAFKTTPEMWLNLQSQYDLWQVKKHKNKKFEKVHCLIVNSHTR